MTVTPTRRAAASGLLLAVPLILAFALAVAAHAELVSSDPADKSTVEGPFDGPIVLTFSEALARGSKADLKGADGSTLASARVAGKTLVFDLTAPLPAGGYTVQWTSVAADRDVLRGTLAFTVSPPPPTPTPTPAATVAATLSPRPTVTPTASPTPTGGGSAAGSAADIVLPLLGLLIAVVALGAFLLRRRTIPR